jgi:cation diffusion facilitator family transporter
MSKNREARILRIQQVAVGLGLIIMLVKFTAYYYTHSNTILTDALESIVNIVAGTFALYSLILSSKPKDVDHPYGHGKIEFIATGFEGILIVLASLLIIWKSILNFFHPEVIHHLEFGVILIVISGTANYLIGYHLEKKAKLYNSLILDADGKHLKADGYISLGILLGVLVIWLTGIQLLDNVFAILAGIFISYTGWRLIRRSLSGIMDETDTTIITSIVEHLNAHRPSSWIDVHNMRVIQYGSTLHVDCHVTLPWYYTLEQTHTEIEDIAQLINQYSPYPVEVFIHPDPCLPPMSCKLCQLKDCAVRQHPFEKKIEWNFANATVNRKHKLEEAK